MRRCIPGWAEVGILAALAIVCAAVLVLSTAENTLLVLAFLITLVAILLGARRAGLFTPSKVAAARAEAELEEAQV